MAMLKRRICSRLAPDLFISGKAGRWAVIAFASLLLVLDLIIIHNNGDSHLDYLAAALIYLTTMYYVFSPVRGGVLAIVSISIFGAIPGISVGALSYVSFIVLFTLSFRRKILYALLGAAVFLVSIYLGLGNGWIAIFPFAGIMFFLIGIGAGFRGYVDKYAQFEVRLEKEKEQLRHDFSAQLHDSLAASLSRVVSLSDTLLKDATSTQARLRLQAVTDESRQALRDLRNTMHILGLEQHSSAMSIDLNTVLSRCQSITSGFQLQMTSKSQFVDEEEIPPIIYQLLEQCLTEATTNMCKYAQPGTECSLTISGDEEQIEIMAVNIISSKKKEFVLSGGAGLSLMQDRVSRVGGTLEASQIGERWVLRIELPLRAKEENEPSN